MDINKLIQGKKGKTLKELGSTTRNLSLDMTEGCSLRCKYCFQDFNGGKKREERKLTEEIMKQQVDWLFKDETSGTVEEVNQAGGLSFEPWGGEPFHNFEMIKKTYEYFVQKSQETGKKIGHIGGTSNGVEWTEENLKWCQERNITWLLSLDGIKEIHDKYRVTPTGQGSFDIIDKNIDLYKKIYGRAPSVRMSLHPDYIPYIKKSYEYIFGKGINDYFFSPVFEQNWTEDSYKELEEQLVELYEQIIVNYKNGFPRVQNKFVDDMIHYILEQERRGLNPDNLGEINDKSLHSLSRGMHLPKPCGQGTTYFGISVDGQIYVCHRFNKHGFEPDKYPFEKRFGWLGNVWEDIHNIELFNELKEWDVDDIEKCKTCKFKYYDKGSCYQSNYDTTGKIKGINEIGCKINEQLYKQQKRIIELFKQNGLFDYNTNNIVIPFETNMYNNQNQLKFDSCYCNSGQFVMNSVERLLNDRELTHQQSEEFKYVVIDAGIQILLNMYKDIMTEKLNKEREKQLQQKVQFNLDLIRK